MSFATQRAVKRILSALLVVMPLASPVSGSLPTRESAHSTASSDGDSSGSMTKFGVNASDNAITATGTRPARSSEHNASNAGSTRYESQRRKLAYCGSLDGLASSPIACIEGVAGGTITRTCADGSVALDPLFRRPIDAAGRYTGPWQQVDNGGCTEDPPVLVILTAADFSRLPLTPSAPLIQPADGHGLVNADLIVYTDPTPQTLTTTVLGIPVTVRATPTTYTWDYGDGTPPLVTADPGQPYPHHTVARPYTAPGDYQLTLSTTWTGTYQINNAGPWLDVLGTATTTSTPQATHITEAHTILTTNP